MKRKITNIETLYYQVPLDRVLVDALHGDHSHFELIITVIHLDDGSEGVGYTYTGGKGGRSILAMIEHDLIPILIGEDSASIEYLWNKMQRHIHYVGRGGVEAFAIATIDIALWDLQAKRAKLPIWRLLGGGSASHTGNKTYKGQVKAYAGAIDLDFTISELVDNNLDYLKQGFQAVKIKLGKPTQEEDIERVRAVRTAIGPDITFMVDANTSWSIDRAITTERILRDFDIFWIEEPIIPDDLNGYAKVNNKFSTPVAAGENFHTIYEFKHMLEQGRIDFPQPDASNISGITGWLKVAQLCYAHNLPVSTHGMQELHVNLLGGMTHSGYLEVHSFPIDRYTTRPLKLEDGYAIPSEEEGHGVTFLWDKLKEYKLN